MERTNHSTRWLAAGYVVLLGGLAAMLGVTYLGFQAQAAVRVLLQAESRWAGDIRDAIIHLQHFGHTGVVESAGAWDDALAYPRAVRVPLRVINEHPGDPDRLEDALLESPLTSGSVAVLRGFTRWFSRNERTRQALGLWLAGDEHVQRIESAADALPAAVSEYGAGSEPVLDVLQEVQAAYADLQQVDEQFSTVIGLWVAELGGRIRWALLVAAVLLAAAGAGLLRFAGLRLTRARRSLLESQDRFRQVTEAIHEVFWLTNVDKSEMLYVSPGYERVWGRTREDLMAAPESWMDPVHPADVDRLRRAVEGQIRGEFDIEYRIVRPDGEVRWVHDRAFPVNGGSERVTRIAGIAEDITHRKELESELVRSRAVMAVGRMAAIVGHELNNLLTVVQSHAALALDEISSADPAVGDLEAISRAAADASSVAGSLLSISRQQMLAPRPVDLEQLLRESHERLRGVLPDTVHLSVDVPYHLPPTWVDPGHLRDAIAALVSHIGAGTPKVVWIEIDRIETPSSVQVYGGQLPAGAYLRLVFGEQGGAGGSRDLDEDALFAPTEIRDTPLDARHAFELPAARGVIAQSGGGISLEAVREEPGARMVVYLPVWEGEGVYQRTR